jgi:DNA-binding winged helix-turn-helix (wHTH) protein
MRVRWGDFAFDLEGRELRRAGRAVPLSPKAFGLLALLIESRPRPLPQSVLRDALWPDSHVGYTSLARVVSEVRKAVGDSARSATLIRTVPRFGYAFAASAVQETGAGTAGADSCGLVADDREFVLPEGETYVGRGPECAVRLPSSQVSRVHARLAVSGRHATLEDQGSKNGTWINGTRLRAPVVLADGDEVMFGTYRLVFRCSGPLVSTRTASSR